MKEIAFAWGNSHTAGISCSNKAAPTIKAISGGEPAIVMDHYEGIKEIVRCKDCKHRFNGEHHDNCCDVLMEKVKWTFEVTVEPDWFCADGERE